MTKVANERVFSYIGVRLGGKSVNISWSAPSLGYGNLYFKFLGKEGLVIETEYMDEKFVEEVIKAIETKIENKEPILEKLTGYDKELLEPEYTLVDKLDDGLNNTLVIAMLRTFLEKAKIRG